MIRDLALEQWKNILLIFRRLDSVLLLIVGPLTLIVLIGFAYSGESVHDIRIGVISNQSETLQSAFANFSSYGSVIQYPDVPECVRDIALQETHICLSFTGDFSEQNGTEPSRGTVTFYFDNSRKVLSNKIVDSISEYFGSESQKISIESASTMFSNIRNLVVFLDRKNDDITILVNESSAIRDSLVERRDRMVAIRGEFLPVYTRIKDIQVRLDEISLRANNSYAGYEQESERTHQHIQALRSYLESLRVDVQPLYIYQENARWVITDNLSSLSDYNQSFYRLADFPYRVEGNRLIVALNSSERQAASLSNVSVDISSLEDNQIIGLLVEPTIYGLDATDESLLALSNDTVSYYGYLDAQKREFDTAVELLDTVKGTLDDDIEMTEEYLVKIDAATANMKQVQEQLNEQLPALHMISPDIAEALVRPILENYEAVVPDVKNIQLAYPGMLAIIVIFLSILFGTIVTLSEIHSRAHLRNLIAPINQLVYVYGLLITTIIVVFFQVVILLIVGEWSFGLPISQNLLQVISVVGLLTLFFACLGIGIAILIKVEQTAILTTTFVALGFFLFSDAVAPLETMPPLAMAFASKNPFVIASLALRKLLVFNVGWIGIAPELALLVVFALSGLVFMTAVGIVRWNR